MPQRKPWMSDAVAAHYESVDRRASEALFAGEGRTTVEFTRRRRPRHVLRRKFRCGTIEEHVRAMKAAIAPLLEGADLMAPDIKRNDRFRWLTAGDDKVCDVCSYMEGLEGSFRVGDLLDQFDAFMEAMEDDLLDEEVESAPFPTIDDVDGLGVNALTEAGIISPPAHPRCRCQIVLV